MHCSSIKEIQFSNWYKNYISKKQCNFKKVVFKMIKTTNEITKKEIEYIINLHKNMKGSYFWTPPAFASSRRNMEERYSFHVEGTFNNQKIDLECRTTCSCKNVYYKGIFYIENIKCTIVKVKNLLKKGKE